MNDSEEANELRKLIREDEEMLARLKEEEAEILNHISKGGFPAATLRANLLSHMHEIEDRLYKNHMRLGKQ